MLSREDNEILTRIGPGTLMGELLRRYWAPACLASELPEPGGAPLRVRLLGEDLVAFRDVTGKVGLVAEHCPHRGASLYFGRNEDGPEACGLRCVYHGWQFNADGRCIDVPSEPQGERFKERIGITAYPTEESGGIVWAYLGPAETITPMRDFGADDLTDQETFVSKVRTDCNWIQVMEGNLDTAHLSALHQFHGVEQIPDDGTDQPGYPTSAMGWKLWRYDRRPRLEIEDTWYGFRYVGMRTTPNGHTHARVTAFVMPYVTYAGSIPFGTRQELQVPADDNTTWRYSMITQRPSTPRRGGGGLLAVTPFTGSWYQHPGGARSGVAPREYNAANDYQIDRDAQRTLSFSGVRDFLSQDLMVTESMGPIYDRTKEHLGSTDLAITKMRSVLLESARGLAAGQQPPALGPDQDYRSIRSAEKILEPGEDWRLLGTNEDPVVREALGLTPTD